MKNDDKERLRTLTVEALLVLRAAYLASPGGNALKHWDILLTRMIAAAKTSTTPEEWMTSMFRRLQLAAPSSSTCSALAELADFVRERGLAREWLSLIEREHGYLIALTRLTADKRREAREGVEK